MDLTGKTALVTGANNGVGAVVAQDLAKKGATVYLACRSETKTRPVIEQIIAATGNQQVYFLELDLASQASIRSCASEFLAKKVPLHVLVNNAGLLSQNGTTKEGFNMTFGVNHIGTFLFTSLLLDTLKQSAPSRLLTVSSEIYDKSGPLKLATAHAKSNNFNEYCQSKLANVLMTLALTKRLEGSGVTAVLANPGPTKSGIWKGLPLGIGRVINAFLKSTEEGARPLIYAATALELEGKMGTFIYYPEKVFDKIKPFGRDEVAAEELWQESIKWTS